MLRHDAGSRRLAVWLAACAGMLDGIGFIGSGGYFVSFMSGNSTRLGVGLAEGSVAALYALSLIASFVLGAFLCTLAKRRIPRCGRSAILLCVAGMLALAALLASISPHFAVFLLLAGAMGALNLVFEQDGDIRIGLTYMTGTLVKLGTQLAGKALGDDAEWRPFLVMWLALALGAGLGAALYAQLGALSLWLAAAGFAALGLTLGRAAAV